MKAMDRTSGQSQVKLSLLRGISVIFDHRLNYPYIYLKTELLYVETLFSPYLESPVIPTAENAAVRAAVNIAVVW
jgi:hypothetical protein